MPAYNANTTLTGATRLRYRLNWGRRVPLTRPDNSIQVRSLEAGLENPRIWCLAPFHLWDLGGPGGPALARQGGSDDHPPPLHRTPHPVPDRGLSTGHRLAGFGDLLRLQPGRQRVAHQGDPRPLRHQTGPPHLDRGQNPEWSGTPAAIGRTRSTQSPGSRSLRNSLHRAVAGGVGEMKQSPPLFSLTQREES